MEEWAASHKSTLGLTTTAGSTPRWVRGGALNADTPDGALNADTADGAAGGADNNDAEEEDDADEDDEDDEDDDDEGGDAGSISLFISSSWNARRRRRGACTHKRDVKPWQVIGKNKRYIPHG